MTVHTDLTGYLERPYLTAPYLTNGLEGNHGMQITFVIAASTEIAQQAKFLNSAENSLGMQAEMHIEGTGDDEYLGMQSDFLIEGVTSFTGAQVDLAIVKDGVVGMQSEMHIEGTSDDEYLGMQSEMYIEGPDDDKFLGMQINLTIVGTQLVKAMEFKADSLSHKLHDVYSVFPYLTRPYLASEMCAFLGMQAAVTIQSPLDDGFLGIQSEMHIEGTGDDEYLGMQSEMHIEDTGDDEYLGMQSEMHIIGPDDDSFTGVQSEMHIVGPDDDKFRGIQTTFLIKDFEAAYGVQADMRSARGVGLQFLATLYNTTNLRILCNFQSRGDATTGGNNTWGNPSGVGLNWKVNIATDAGPDHGVENLNTDIVEQTWKSAGATSGVNLDCDTERSQGVFMDTFSIQNHNFSKAATVALLGSNDSTFGVIGVTVPLTVLDEPNVYHIAEELPNTSYRYWRIAIDDSTNADGFIEVGTVVFGAARVFSGECITDQISLERKDFADTIATEGFTNIANSRTQKKIVDLDFRSLAFERGNYQILRDIFTNSRTILKCLWIPTPDLTDNEFMARFAVFSKISKIPKEKHNSKGPKLDFASFGLTLDESK